MFNPFAHRSLARRTLLKLSAAVAICLSLPAFAADPAPKKVLFLTKSSGSQHSVVARDAKDPSKPAHAERLLTEIAAKAGFTVTFTKDADVFNDPATYQTYDVFAFYTTTDLTQPSDKYSRVKGPDGKDAQGPILHTEKPMSADGKKMFLQALADGKGFIGFHCASDTFHSKNSGEMLRPADAKDKVDPYIQMIGGEFTGHGSQQPCTMRFVSQTFPGLEDLKDFTLTEEWYGLKNLAPDMHVILIQDTNTMKADKNGKRENDYNRPPYPATWAKNHGKGRVFYTSMGHREDVWTNPIFQKVVTAGLNWAGGNTSFDPKPNMDQTAPQPRKN